MRLVIGGYAQGKREYVLEKYRLPETAVWDAALPAGEALLDTPVVIDHFHLWVKGCMERGESPRELFLEFLQGQEDCIVISDEVGNGIVPLDPKEREYREGVGRLLTELAAMAEEVERVICGIGQKLK